MGLPLKAGGRKKGKKVPRSTNAKKNGINKGNKILLRMDGKKNLLEAMGRIGRPFFPKREVNLPNNFEWGLIKEEVPFKDIPYRLSFLEEEGIGIYQ